MWPLILARSHILDIEHEAFEFVFDAADFPGLVGAFEVFKVVVAVDVNQSEFLVFGVVTLLLEKRVEFGVGFLGHVAPDHQRLFTGGVQAGDDLEAANGVRVAHAQAEQIIERLHQIHVHGARFAHIAGGDLELVGERVAKTALSGE